MPLHLTNIKVSAGTSSTNLSALTYADSNGISFGLSGSTLTAAHNALTSQSNQAASASNGSFAFQTVGFSNANNITFGTSAGSIITGSINTSLTNIKISAGTSSTNLSALTYADSNGVSFGLNGSTLTASINTSLTNIKISAGTSSTNLSALTYADSNGISFGLNGSTMTASHNGLTSQSNQAASAANGSFAFQTISFSNLNGISFGTSAGSAITASTAETPRSFFAFPDFVQSTISFQVSGSSSYMQPFFLPYDMSVSYIRMPISGSIQGSMTAVGTANNVTRGFTLSSTINLGLYSQGVGLSSRSLITYATSSATLIQQATIQAAGTGSNWSSGHTISYPVEGGTSTTTVTGAATSASFTLQSSQLSNFTGMRFLDIPFATSLSAGAYWMLYGSSSSVSTSGTANLSTVVLLASNFVHSQPNQGVGIIGVATNSSIQFRQGLGSFSTNTIATTSGVALANVSTSASNPIIPFQMIRQV